MGMLPGGFLGLNSCVLNISRVKNQRRWSRVGFRRVKPQDLSEDLPSIGIGFFLSDSLSFLPGILRDVEGGSGMFRDVKGGSEMFRNVQGASGMLRNVPGMLRNSLGMFRNALGGSRMNRDAQGSAEIHWGY